GQDLRPRRVDAAEHDGPDVQQVDRRRDRAPETTARAADVGQRFQPCDRLQAAARATAALRAVRLDGHVPDLTGPAPCPGEQAPVEDDARADADLAGD